MKTVVEPTSEPRHTSGSRNLPTGSQPSRKAKIQIIISAKAGVKTVKSAVPVMVAAYSRRPPRRQAIAFPSRKPM